jgi:hypothetical protein
MFNKYVFLIISLSSSFALASASRGAKQTDKVLDYYGIEQNLECLEGYKCPAEHSREFFKIVFIPIGISSELAIQIQEKVKNVVIRFSQNNIKIDTKGLTIYMDEDRLDNKTVFFPTVRTSHKYISISKEASEEDIEGALSVFYKIETW